MNNEKIRKILALTASPNENESQAAMLKLRELLHPEDKKPKDTRDTENKTAEKRTKFTFSNRNDPWMAELSELIARKHGCVTYQIKRKKGSILTVVLYGYPHNVEIAEYALDAAYKQIKRNLQCYSDLDAQVDYAYGYIKGLYKIYCKQDAQKQKEGLPVISVANEIENRKRVIRSRSAKSHTVINHEAHRTGMKSAI